MKLIPLTQGKEALVDDEDYDFLMQWKWHFAKWYAVRALRPSGRCVYMHRVVNNTPDDMRTDHVDGDGLNNQKLNLRSCSQAQNVLNRVANKKKMYSMLKGVTWHKGIGKWMAQFTSDGRRIYLGYFPTEQLAHEAYCRASEIHHGEFGRTK